jgi:hypothetical protein
MSSSTALKSQGIAAGKELWYVWAEQENAHFDYVELSTLFLVQIHIFLQKKWGTRFSPFLYDDILYELLPQM